ncbi:glycoside hydrolase 5 family protein [Saccharothrix variisporea]|uniref:glycoside hydrolase 5 family protein n=1 Tax=Saccharothrix variisporea TaxID=543527 RepID=UPI001B875519|nr:glycosyl hydrolase [Saccharothrix variisporea]
MTTSLRLGANYVPSAGWFYSWLDFSADAVRRDFADLAGLGLDHVRVFPIWPWIQPNRGLLRPVDDLLTTLDIAAEFGLEVAVDLLQGHLSSFDFLPSWVLTWHRRSVFTDRDVRDGIAAYAAYVSEAAASRANVFAITLGNEVNNLWPANPATPEASRAWAAELVDVVREAAPGVAALYSVYDDAWYAPDHPFHPADAVELGDLTTVHSWVFNGTSRIDGPLGPATLTHADYLVSLAAAAAPGRPVWLQEVGVPRPDVPAGNAAAFVRGTLAAVADNPALWGVTWWSSHDIDRSLLDFPDREYDLGLFTTDHRRKPAAEALAEFAGTTRAAAARPTAVACPVDLLTEPHRRAEVAPGSAFHLEWVRRRQEGPVMIEPAHVSARG